MFMDHALSQRLERSEGTICASYVSARCEVSGVPASWHDFAGTYAIFDGADSPMTQTFGLGMFGPVTAEGLAAIEDYFTSRQAPTAHEVSPLAGTEVLSLLIERGYRPIEHSSVLVQPLSERHAAPETGPLHVRTLDAAHRSAWVEASVAGWSADPTISSFIRALAEVGAANPAMTHFFVEREGALLATASLGLHDGIALLAGASTIPSARGLGAQGMLLAARLDAAHARGAHLALMLTSPGSASQRNAERSGFRIAYTRTKWLRAVPD